MGNLPPGFEFDPLSLEARFTSLIDARFAEGGASDRTSRQHEERLGMIAAHSFSLCPSATRFFLDRPKPDEAEEALALWSQFGGHRVYVFESAAGYMPSFLESHFFAIGDTLYVRREHMVPGESVMAPPDALDEAQAQELMRWIETGIAEP